MVSLKKRLTGLVYMDGENVLFPFSSVITGPHG
jgi:hypothetical protein